ncbi:NAD(P)H-binding protein [Rhodococcoides yunnanense]|uniref:NAD(P)H-binding protein n=1 Tax=Rhodococcoides yunnanense TaxID=278209 RepID=A0ABU4BID7_9NOCA|nr:NAD(P)H-binding protein [Rhodococcus yunnanensis]MDV6263943.1 NAD(P)H-binding protein [Rhodococcus yunnanensis]
MKSLRTLTLRGLIVFLVTGATGRVGRHVVNRLLVAGENVRALTRDPKAADLPTETAIVGGDLSLPDSVVPAMRGVTALFLFPAGSAAGAVLRTARDHGVRRVVMLSSSSVEYDTEVADNPIVSYHKELERQVVDSGLEWTLVRPCAFASNTLQWAQSVRSDGIVRGPNAELRNALVHEQDIADVIANALLGDKHGGARYLVTGPEALSRAEQVQRIGEVTGQCLRYEEISPIQARANMIRAGMPADMADLTLQFEAQRIDAEPVISSPVEKMTGRPPRTYKQWVTEHSEAFAVASGRLPK